MTTGRFITFEGGEGAGKTTQAERLQGMLENAGYEVVTTREPGGTFGAERIRELVLSGSHDRWSGMTELLLMYAARLDHVEKLIRPALDRGVWVLCDRFSDSSLVYQGYARGLGPERVAALHNVVLGDFGPDMTFLFDIDPILAQSRVKNRGEELSRFDTEELEFHKKIRAGFLELAAADPGRFHVLDAESSRDAISTQIAHAIMKKYPDVKLG